MVESLKRTNAFLKTKIAQIKAHIDRAFVANVMMFLFIILTSTGAFLIYEPAGFITAGFACGLFGFLLGQE